MGKITGLVIDFVVGMLVCAYLLSHTEIGRKLYNTIAPLPTITAKDISNAMDAASKAGSKAIEIGGRIYNITK